MVQRTILPPQLLHPRSARRFAVPSKPPPLVRLKNASFYRQHPSSEIDAQTNLPIFPNINYSLLSNNRLPYPLQLWAVISSSSLARTAFLKTLAGQYICHPPTARTYPYLTEIDKSPQDAIKYVGFDAERGGSVGGNNVRGAYLSARYESRREEDDFTLQDYLSGHTELNALEDAASKVDETVLASVVDKLNLRSLLTMPVANLSNGQTRRARIAKALMARPKLLLLDGPFMGLDPNTLAMLSEVLRSMAVKQQPRLVLSLRPEDAVPDWISHLMLVSDDFVVRAQGRKAMVLGSHAYRNEMAHLIQQGEDAADKLSIDEFPKHSPALPPGEPVVEMLGVKVTYGTTTVLGDWQQQEGPGLHFTLSRGQRTLLCGPNGSGKTTLLSLITSDHPQTYSQPIRLFGRSRLPSTPGEPGISVFDLQQRMGHSSPEVHAFFPKRLTVRRTLESAWADAPMAKPDLDKAKTHRVDMFLHHWARELKPGFKTDATPGNGDDGYFAWVKETNFAELSFSNQRLLLFLRALIASPDLVILDEAFSGMDDTTREKAMRFLSLGGRSSLQEERTPRGFGGLEDRQALLVIAHAKEDVPGCVRDWVCLPEPGEGRRPRTGTLEGPLELSPGVWEKVWGRG